MENLFFDRNQLKKCGKNVIIGKTVRIRYPELVEIGDNVILDDFIYISTSLKIENNVHVSSGCKFIGGRSSFVSIDEYSTLAPNVVLSAGSDDYVSGIGSVMLPQGEDFEMNNECGNISLGKYVIIGTSSLIMPNVKVGDGSSIGALSLVKDDVSSWELHAGIPSKKIKDKDKDKILKIVKKIEVK